MQSVAPSGDADAKHHAWLLAISLLALTVALGAMAGYVWRMRPARARGTENDASDGESPRGGNARATRSPAAKRRPTVSVPQCLVLHGAPADFRRFRAMLKLIDDAVGTKVHHATRSSFAEVSRAAFRTAE